MNALNNSFMGYVRENGRVGVRNHVAILPVDDISNAACEAVANNIKGTMALPHAYGRLQFGEDLELHFRTMIGTGSNPNIAACVVIGIEPGWTPRIVDGIAKTGKPVVGFSIEQNGDINTIAAASSQAQSQSPHKPLYSDYCPSRSSSGNATQGLHQTATDHKHAVMPSCL
jgi:(2R)-sulfolactate sulfo-lyase subunit beta